MNTPSLLVVVVSLALAAGMGIILLRMLRNERRRSDARVEALARMAEPDFHSEQVDGPAESWVPGEAVDGSFEQPEAPSRWGNRAAIAGGIAILALVVFMIALVRSPSSSDTATTTSAGTEVASAPLALLALSHTQSAGSLTVSGRVQNPPGGQSLESLTATVFLFGADGSFLTSGRSPLDVQPLGAGDESAFVVNIPVNGSVSRYRVSFRDGAGRAVAHADRRNVAAMVRNE
jgi:hypothetical protein